MTFDVCSLQSASSSATPTFGSGTGSKGRSPAGSLRFKIHDGSLQLAPQHSPYCIVEFEDTEVVSNIAALTPIPNDRLSATRYRKWTWNQDIVFDVANSSDAEIGIFLYARSFFDPASSPKEDVFLGHSRVKLPLPVDSETLLAFDFGSGTLNISAIFKRSTHKLSPSSFNVLRLLGRGSFGKVLLVKKKDTGAIYAMKVLNKQELLRRNEVEHTISERNVLSRGGPFIVSLKFSFQTSTHLHLLLPFLSGGELFFHLQNSPLGFFSETRAKFYAAELVLALEYLHDHGIIYRDLKPENILLDTAGHISLVDFGLCKDFQTDQIKDGKTNTFCGTAEYLAPEILKGETYGKEVDWWSLGILLYEMLTSLPPFYEENVSLMYRKILYQPLIYPPYVSHIARLLLNRLLDRKLSTRLGSGKHGADDIKSHMFFAGMNWQKLVQKEVVPPFKPKLDATDDVRYFDQEFTLDVENLENTPASQDEISQSMQQRFEGFSWAGASVPMDSYMASKRQSRDSCGHSLARSFGWRGLRKETETDLRTDDSDSEANNQFADMSLDEDLHQPFVPGGIIELDNLPTEQLHSHPKLYRPPAQSCTIPFPL